MPDGIASSTTKYDALLLTLATRASRMIDNLAGRTFYPQVATRYLRGDEDERSVDVADLIWWTSIAYSVDDGRNYTTIASTEIVGTVFGDENSKKSYTCLELIPTSAALFPGSFRGVQVGSGIWAYTDDRTNKGFEDSGMDLSSSAIVSATTLSVADVTLADAWGFGAAIQVGRIVRINSEFMEVVSVTNSTGSTDTIGVVRAVNGSSATAHSSGSSLYIWRVPPPIKEACIITVVKWLERGLQAFGDARGTTELGAPVWEKRIDVQAEMLIRQYARF
jgi:hypothetical protein